jgi:hypothetical protein
MPRRGVKHIRKIRLTVVKLTVTLETLIRYSNGCFYKPKRQPHKSRFTMGGINSKSRGAISPAFVMVDYDYL